MDLCLCLGLGNCKMALPLPLLFLLLTSSFLSLNLNHVSSTPVPAPAPEPWPQQFHAVLFMNHSNQLSMIDLWYDWPAGRNFNIITDQLGGPPLFDLEWNNGTSFFYTLQEPLTCRSAHLEVGVLRPNWLDGAAYLGRATVDGFLCDAWTKADFIWYYQDVQTKRPVKWVFYTGRTAHVMTYEVGAVLEDEAWQAPLYCFQNSSDATSEQEQQLENQADPLTINQNLMLMLMLMLMLRQRQSSQSL